MVQSDGIEVRILRHSDRAPYQEYFAPPESRAYRGDPRDVYIEAEDNERFVIAFKVTSDFKFSRSATARVKYRIDDHEGGRSYIAKRSDHPRNWLDVGAEYTYENGTATFNGVEKEVGFFFAALNIDETQDPSNEEIARDLERVGKIVVEVQRGRVVKKVLLAGEEASDDAVTAGQTESSTHRCKAASAETIDMAGSTTTGSAPAESSTIMATAEKQGAHTDAPHRLSQSKELVKKQFVSHTVNLLPLESPEPENMISEEALNTDTSTPIDSGSNATGATLLSDISVTAQSAAGKPKKKPKKKSKRKETRYYWYPANDGKGIGKKVTFVFRYRARMNLDLLKVVPTISPTEPGSSCSTGAELSAAAAKPMHGDVSNDSQKNAAKGKTALYKLGGTSTLDEEEDHDHSQRSAPRIPSTPETHAAGQSLFDESNRGSATSGNVYDASPVRTPNTAYTGSVAAPRFVLSLTSEESENGGSQGLSDNDVEITCVRSVASTPARPAVPRQASVFATLDADARKRKRQELEERLEEIRIKKELRELEDLD